MADEQNTTPTRQGTPTVKDVTTAVNEIMHDMYDRLVQAQATIFKWKVISAFLLVIIIAMTTVVVVRL